MCESSAFVVTGDKEELLLKDVIKIVPLQNGKLLVENLLGDQLEFNGKIREIDFMGHKILLENK